MDECGGQEAHARLRNRQDASVVSMDSSFEQTDGFSVGPTDSRLGRTLVLICRQSPVTPIKH